MKKLFILLLSFCLSWSFLPAGITTVTQWKMGNQIITIYHDDLFKGTNQENRQHFDYIKENIIKNKAPRNRPLTMLVQNNCSGPFEYYTYEINRLTNNPSFLAMFDGVMSTTHDIGEYKICIKSIIPDCALLVVDLLQNARYDEQLVLTEDFLTTLLQDLNQVSFQDFENSATHLMQQYCDAAKNSEISCLFQATKKLLAQNLRDFKKIFNKSSQLFDEKCIMRSIADIFVKNNAYESMHNLLAPLVDATLVYETLSTDGDLAIFTSTERGFMLDEILEALSFVRDDLFFEDPQDNTQDREALKPNSAIMPTTIYDWMKK